RAGAADTRSTRGPSPAADRLRPRRPSSTSVRPTTGHPTPAHHRAAARLPRGPLASTPVPDLAPCARPCDTENRRARTSSGPPRRRLPTDWDASSTSPTRGTAAGSCQQYPTSFGKALDLLAGDDLVAA